MSTTPEANPRQQKAQTFFNYANDAALKSNFDYAIQMYQEACKLVPDDLRYRQALRGIERRKFGGEPAKVGRLVGARTQPIKLRVRHAKSQEKWAHVLEVCEEVFVHNPWDVHASRDAAEAAEHLGMAKVAQWLLESVQGQAEDADYLRHLGQIHELNEDWAKAISAWEKVRKVAPNDELAGRKINALSANATIQRSGLKENLERRSAAAEDEEAAKPDAEEVKRQAMSPEERLRQVIREEPKRVGPYLELADHFRQRNQLDQAWQVLAAGLKTNPDDGILIEAHAELQIVRLKQFLEKGHKKLQEDPTNAELKTKIAQVADKLVEYETTEARRKIAQRPDDMNLRYQLGVTLAGAGRHDEAIAEFQQSRTSPALKVKSLLKAGLSFEANNVHKLAERNYQEALKSAGSDDPATLNELHYRLGRVAEIQGNIQAAEEHYNEVAANDYSYADVAVRLRSLNQKPST